MDLIEAETYAEYLLTEIRALCDNVLVAGSIRRKKPIIGDIDIVVIPKGQRDVFWDAIATRLENRGFKKVKHGPKLMTYQHPKAIFTVDIYRATPEIGAF